MKDKTIKMFLSLLISIILWFYINSLVTKEIEFAVDIKYTDIPPNMIIVGKQETFFYNLIVNKYSYYETKQPPIEVKVSLKDAKIGKNYIKPEIIKKIDIPYSARLVLKEKTVFVELDRKEIKEVEINPIIINNSFIIKDINIYPKKIKIEGPLKQVKSITKLDTTEIFINDSGQYSELVPIKNPNNKNIYLSSEFVKVEFKALSKTIEEKIVLPVKVKNLNDEFEYEINPTTIIAMIKAPSEKIKELDLSKLYFYVDLKEINSEGIYKLNLKIDTDFLIEPVDTKNITVIIKRRTK